MKHRYDGDCLREIIFLRLSFSSRELTWRLIIESLTSKTVALDAIAKDIERQVKEGEWLPVRSQKGESQEPGKYYVTKR